MGKTVNEVLDKLASEDRLESTKLVLGLLGHTILSKVYHIEILDDDVQRREIVTAIVTDLRGIADQLEGEWRET